MNSAQISDSWHDRCSETKSAHPSTPRTIRFTHYQASLSVNPQRACIITNSYNTTSCSCESAVASYFQILPNSGKFMSHSRLSTIAAQPPVDIFIALSLKWREMVWKCLKSNSNFINITTVWCAQCALAPANGLCYVHPQIPGASRVVRFPLTSIYSQYFARFQSCRGRKVFYYSLLKEREGALHQKPAVLHAGMMSKVRIEKETDLKQN